MEKRASAPARIAAAAAIVAGLVAVIAVLSTAGGDGGGSSGAAAGNAKQREAKRPRVKAKTYVVRSGDTLTAISHRTGVPVAEILALNPDVDPQILIAGQKLKLR